MKFTGESILSISQFDLDDIHLICSTADRLQKYSNRQFITRVLEGAVLANLFFEPSTRTRISFGSAFNRLGGAVRDTAGTATSSISKGESLADTSRVVSGYSDVVVVRHPDEKAISEFAAASRVPVINAGNGPGEHPTQALLDYYTLRKELSAQNNLVDGMNLAIVGDLRFGRTVHSLVKLISLNAGISFRLASPPGLELPSEFVELIGQRGHSIETFDLPEQAIANANAVYCTRLQTERFGDLQLNPMDYSSFRIDRRLIANHARADVVIMHPLPRDGRENAIDLSNDLNGDPRLAIFRQTDAGIPIRMALFALVLGVADKVDDTARPVAWHVKKFDE